MTTTALDQVIATAFASQGRQADVNQVYLTFLQSLLYVPVKQELNAAENDFAPLFATIDDHYFMLAFDAPERLMAWAGDQAPYLRQTELSGHQLILNVPQQVYLSLNIGSPFYKEFSPEEIAQLKKIANKMALMKE